MDKGYLSNNDDDDNDWDGIDFGESNLLMYSYEYNQRTRYTASVIFHTNGGTPTQQARIINFGDPIGVLPVVTRNGFTFVDWYTNLDGNDPINANTIPFSAGSFGTQPAITYFAVWRVDAPNIISPTQNEEVFLDDITITWVPISSGAICYLTLEELDLVDNDINNPNNQVVTIIHRLRLSNTATGTNFTISKNNFRLGCRYRITIFATFGNDLEGSTVRHFRVRESSPVELLTTREVYNYVYNNWGVTIKEVKLMDIATGEELNIAASFGRSYHTDWSPMRQDDTRTVQRILRPDIDPDDPRWKNGTSHRPYNEVLWSWGEREGILTIGNRRVAVSFHLVPHASVIGERIGADPGSPLKNGEDRVETGWPIGGHMCMYYGDSDGGSGSVNSRGESFGYRMNKAAKAAHETASNESL